MRVRSSVERGVQRSQRLQRFFSTFPSSWPGIGLLLLRTVAGGAAASQGGSLLASSPEPGVGAWVLAGSAVASGASLMIGLFTPAAGVAAGVSTILIALSWIAVPASSVLIDRTAALLVMTDAAALALLGPGALSVDAYLFGRREITIPHDPRGIGP